MADPPAPNLARLIQGPTLVGTFFNLILYGVSLTQVYIYFTTYKRDQLWLKVYICCLFLADTINSVFDMFYSYDRLVNNFGNMDAQGIATWVFAAGPAMTGIMGATVQMFFGWRVKVLTGNMWAVSVIVTLAVAELLGGLATAIATGFVPEFLDTERIRSVVIVWLVSSAIVDTLITVILVSHLRKNRTGFEFTDDVINKIIRLTVQTGMITSVWAIIDLGLYLGSPSGVHVSFNWVLAKLYTNSLMSSLNSRAGWKYGSSASNNQSGQSRSNPEFSFNKRPPEVVSFYPPTTRPEIYVNVESHEMTSLSEGKPGADPMTNDAGRSNTPTGAITKPPRAL